MRCVPLTIAFKQIFGAHPVDQFQLIAGENLPPFVNVEIVAQAHQHAQRFARLNPIGVHARRDARGDAFAMADASQDDDCRAALDRCAKTFRAASRLKDLAGASLWRLCEYADGK